MNTINGDKSEEKDLERADLKDSPKEGSKNSKLASFQTFYDDNVRPWIYILVFIVVILYIFLVSGNLTTYRNNSNSVFDMSFCNPLLARRQHRLQLPDLGFAKWEPQGGFWMTFLTITPGLALGFLGLVVLYLRDIVFVTKIIWVEGIIMAIKAVAQVVTSLPDPYGKQGACTDEHFYTFGSWVFTRVSTEFCGDCIWSGHTFHTLFAILFIAMATNYRSPCPSYLSDLSYNIIYWTVSGLWFLLLIICILFQNFHYSADIWLAIFITLLVITHTPLVELGPRLLYKPKKSLRVHPSATVVV